jgi:hypothetical protein
MGYGAVRCGAVRWVRSLQPTGSNRLPDKVPPIARLKEPLPASNFLCFASFVNSSDPTSTMDGLLAEINAKRKELESDVQAGPSKKYMRRAEVEAAKEEEDRRRRDKLRKEREEREAAKAAKARSDVSGVELHFLHHGAAAVV